MVVDWREGCRDVVVRATGAVPAVRRHAACEECVLCLPGAGIGQSMGAPHHGRKQRRRERSLAANV